MPSVSFFLEDIDFALSHPRKKTKWVKDTIKAEGKGLKELNFIFCSDSYLHKLNLGYLNHDTFTDIVTFDNSEDTNTLEGDIFISIERVAENAARFNTSFDNELSRVMIHGVLHLIGYGDKTSSEKSKMRRKEEAYLSLLGRST